MTHARSEIDELVVVADGLNFVKELADQFKTSLSVDLKAKTITTTR